MCHTLLGPPWQYDKRTTLDGKENTYTFIRDGACIKLIPEKEPLRPPKSLTKSPRPKPPATTAKVVKGNVSMSPVLLTQACFKRECRETCSVIMLVAKEVFESPMIPPVIQHLLEKYNEFILENFLMACL